ncbi:2-dehydropantoate 2-reductase [Paenibacillus rhizovicinus]|uniref:2-dehydropantoate 2-reductase n=1 Tax=Paenibacillus rhizovicinus TaxID=2704463 RepID=A0A6C0P0Y8_9BACL|nr:2-dehydropantoate 2-reductase [Paenibacillus rhizovicinus]QHW30392.1 2-dehydropantoate 2-reductase [Paenibacillus rhizovicinus]
MKIMIVGAGALGLLYAARLAEAGEDVLLLTRTDEQAQTLQSEGLLYKDVTGIERLVKIPAQSANRYADCESVHAFAADWILLTVKQPDVNETLFHVLRRAAASGASILALQNGVGHLERLREALPAASVYAAITTEGALRPDLCAVIHTGTGLLTFGGWSEDEKNDAKPQKMLLEALINAGIQAKLSKEMKDQVFLKLLINAVVNPLTAIFQVKNGELPQDPYRLKIMRALHDESETILRAAGMASGDDLWERLLGVCAATAANESSMLRDVRAGRVTEIDWINGGIIQRAKRLGMPSRMNEAVIALVEAL